MLLEVCEKTYIFVNILLITAGFGSRRAKNKARNKVEILGSGFETLLLLWNEVDLNRKISLNPDPVIVQDPILQRKKQRNNGHFYLCCVSRGTYGLSKALSVKKYQGSQTEFFDSLLLDHEGFIILNTNQFYRRKCSWILCRFRWCAFGIRDDSVR